VRIIAATHRDLDAAMLEGRFREDLFYRLNVFPLQMPPLRERLDDLPVLIEHLIQRQSNGANKSIRFDASAMACLARNRWPGNVRELANLLERLAILFPGQTITDSDLPDRYRSHSAVGWLGSEVRIDARPEPAEDRVSASIAAAEEATPVLYDMSAMALASSDSLPRGGLDLKDHLSAIEIGLIRQALTEADGTIAEAARLLRMRRTTLVEKLRKYRLSA
jgi:sigma-54 specific flagellar transcriptional regulator A